MEISGAGSTSNGSCSALFNSWSPLSLSSIPSRSWTDELRDVVWLEGREGYISSCVGSWCDLCLSTSHEGLISLEDLKSVERGRVFCFGGSSASDLFEESGFWDRDRAVLDERPGRRKWKGTAVGEDGRAAVVCVGLDISESEKSRY